MATSKSDTSVYTIRINKGVIPCLKKMAAREHRSLTNLIARILEEATSNGTKR